MKRKIQGWQSDKEESDKEIHELLDRIAALTAENTALRQENMRLSGECHTLYEINKDLEATAKHFEALTGITKLLRR